MPIRMTMKLRRISLGLTQAQVAAQLGVATATVHRWETGQRTPGIRQAMRLAQVLDYPVTELFPLTDPQPSLLTSLLTILQDPPDGLSVGGKRKDG